MLVEILIFLHQGMVTLQYWLDTVDDVGELSVLHQGGEGGGWGGAGSGLEKEIHDRWKVAADLTRLLIWTIWSKKFTI